jgi:putative endonuclease
MHTMSTRHYVLYVLELRDGKYYVGTTEDFTARLRQHERGSGAAWTKKYGVVSVQKQEAISTDGVEARFAEDTVVKKMMLAHGMDSVRGGSYCTTTLSELQQKNLVIELRHASNQCLRCGSSEHFISRCTSHERAPSQRTPPPPVRRVTWPPQKDLAELWQIPKRMRNPLPPSGQFLSIARTNTKKTRGAQAPYIIKRLALVAGKTVREALRTEVPGKTRGSLVRYRKCDLVYDI